MGVMTRLPGVPDAVDDVRPGMASFLGGGPLGSTCGTCRFRGMWKSSKPKFDKRTQQLDVKRTHVNACQVYARLAMKMGPAVEKAWPACKYWEGIKR